MTLNDIYAALPHLSLAELKQLPDMVSAEIAAKEKAEKAKAKAELEELARAKGFEIDDLFGGKGTKTKAKGTVPPKYRNPDNAEETWTGRGRKPKWVVAALERGLTLESFAI